MNIVGIDNNGKILVAQTNAPVNADSSILQNGFVAQAIAVPDDEAALAVLSVTSPVAYWDGAHVTAIPASPGTAYTWDWPSKTWVLNLAQGRSIAWARIKSARDAAIAAGVTYNGNVYDSDATAQLRVTGAATMAQLAIASGDTAYSVTWTLANNSTVTLTAQEVIAMAQAVGANYQTMFAKGQTLRAQIMAATTQAELDAVVW